LIITFPTFSQTADDIIDKYIEAIGGVDKINSIKTIKLSVTMTMLGIDIPTEIIYKRPNKIWEEAISKTTTFIKAYNGLVAWKLSDPLNKGSKPEILDDEETKKMLKQSRFEKDLVNYKNKGYTAEFIDTENLDGTNVYKIRLSDKENITSDYYIDINSYFLIQEIVVTQVQGNEFVITNYFKNYKSADGYYVPYSFAVKIKMGTVSSTIEGNVKKIDINIDVDDNIFELPQN